MKCHNDENSPSYKVFQTSANRFGTHWSAERRILSALGGALTDPLGETHCYGCHTGGTAGNDFYGVRADDVRRPDAIADAVRASPPSTRSSAGGGNSVECENCHNPHVVIDATGKVTDPANTYNAIAYATDADKATFCLKCHSARGIAARYTVNDATYVPSTVTIAAGDQALMNKSTYGARGHWSASGSIALRRGQDRAPSATTTTARTYRSCSARTMPATGTNKVNGAAITGNDNTVCSACHTAASTGLSDLRRDDATAIRPMAPGRARRSTATAYNPATSTGCMHNTANAMLPGSAYAGGDCKNCHDVHGTANTYDELRTEDARHHGLRLRARRLQLLLQLPRRRRPRAPATSSRTSRRHRWRRLGWRQPATQIRTAGGNLPPGGACRATTATTRTARRARRLRSDQS